MATWGWPHGLMVKLGVHCFGGPGSAPGCGPRPLISSHAVVATHTQNRGRVAELLTQGTSSSSKKKKIGNRC